MELDKEYWNDRYAKGNTGWNIGSPSTPLAEYIGQLENKGISILIPGCGSAYEADYLLEQGFTDITLLDVADEITAPLRERFNDKPQVKVITGSFFEHEGDYDLVLEQTFFCALNRKLRREYYKKMYNLLNAKGKIAGVMFGVEFEKEGPPFGGTAQEYLELMQEYFNAKTMEKCYNSIPKRQGNELFVILERK